VTGTLERSRHSNTPSTDSGCVPMRLVACSRKTSKFRGTKDDRAGLPSVQIGDEITAHRRGHPPQLSVDHDVGKQRTRLARFTAYMGSPVRARTDEVAAGHRE
jgi:hypothetical protein